MSLKYVKDFKISSLNKFYFRQTGLVLGKKVPLELIEYVINNASFFM